MPGHEPIRALVRHTVPVALRPRPGARTRFLLDPVDTPVSIPAVDPSDISARRIPLDAWGGRILDAFVFEDRLWHPLQVYDENGSVHEADIEQGLAVLALGLRYDSRPEALRTHVPPGMVDPLYAGGQPVPASLVAKATVPLHAIAVARMAAAGGRDLIHDGRRILAACEVPLVNEYASAAVTKLRDMPDWCGLFLPSRANEPDDYVEAAGLPRPTESILRDRAAFLPRLFEALDGLVEGEPDLLHFAHCGAVQALSLMRDAGVRDPALQDALADGIGRTAIGIRDDLPETCARVDRAAESVASSTPKGSLKAVKAVHAAMRMRQAWRRLGSLHPEDMPHLGGFAP
jgi:hypothetical protein